ncbi:hypothetical protein BV20DRAFT_982769 [Pilatotrama ljubarskyi]|nr:hypothetical protein BV20DRAFT_982769 [Pilatotrama ljubarskyi]
MSTPANMESITLEKALNPATYEGCSTAFIEAVIRRFYAECAKGKMENLTRLFQAIGRGWYLTSIKNCKPHSDQRPILGSHADRLKASLCGSDQRLKFPAFFVVDTEHWESLLRHHTADPATIEEVPEWSPPPGVTLTYLTHGHRIHAMLDIDKEDPVTPQKAWLHNIYTPRLLWTAIFLPRFVLDILPSSIITMYILAQNHVDINLKKLEDPQMMTALFLTLDFEYRQIYGSDDAYNPAAKSNKDAVDYFKHLVGTCLGGDYSVIQGEQALSHPKILHALARGSEYGIGRTVPKTALSAIWNSGCWPLSCYLEAAADQLSPFAGAPWATCSDIVDIRRNDAPVTLTLNEMAKLDTLAARARRGQVFVWLLPDAPIAERIEAMKALVEKLRKNEKPTNPYLATLLQSENAAVRADGEYSLLLRGEDKGALLWHAYFSARGMVSNFRGRWEFMGCLTALLVWVLYGGSWANLFSSNSPFPGQEPHIWGKLPWWRTADGPILNHLAEKRKLSEIPGYKPSIPSAEMTIAQVYRDAHPEDLTRLYKIAAILIDNHVELINDLPKSLKHVTSTGDEFFWLPKEKAGVAKYTGSDLMKQTKRRFAKALVSFEVDCNVNTSSTDRAVKNYARAIANVLQHPAWQRIVAELQLGNQGSLFNLDMSPIPTVNPASPSSSHLPFNVAQLLQAEAEAPGPAAKGGSSQSEGTVLVFNTQDPRAGGTPPWIRLRQIEKVPTPPSLAQKSTEPSADNAEPPSTAQTEPAHNALPVPPVPTTQTSTTSTAAPVTASKPQSTSVYVAIPSRKALGKRKERAVSVSEAGRTVAATGAGTISGGKVSRVTEDPSDSMDVDVPATSQPDITPEEQLADALNRASNASVVPASEPPQELKGGGRRHGRGRGGSTLSIPQRMPAGNDEGETEKDDDEYEEEPVIKRKGKGKQRAFRGRRVRQGLQEKRRNIRSKAVIDDSDKDTNNSDKEIDKSADDASKVPESSTEADDASTHSSAVAKPTAPATPEVDHTQPGTGSQQPEGNAASSSPFAPLPTPRSLADLLPSGFPTPDQDAWNMQSSTERGLAMQMHLQPFHQEEPFIESATYEILPLIAQLRETFPLNPRAAREAFRRLHTWVEGEVALIRARQDPYFNDFGDDELDE